MYLERKTFVFWYVSNILVPSAKNISEEGEVWTCFTVQTQKMTVTDDGEAQGNVNIII